MLLFLTQRGNIYIVDVCKRAMFGWLFGEGKVSKLEDETKKSFGAVKKDIESMSQWIKHLDAQDKQLFDVLSTVKQDLSSIQDEIGGLKEAVGMMDFALVHKQASKKSGVGSGQTADSVVVNSVQTGVQTDSFYDIFRQLSANERLLVFTMMNSEMKLSYEDLALLLGKERSTVRGQINAIKQKSEGLIEELVEKNGKKRVFIPDQMKQKLAKYAKVRVKGRDKPQKLPKFGENDGE